MILVIDDDRDILNAIERLMRTQKIKILTTTCTLNALELLKEKKISIIISDYQMTKLNGIDFLIKAKEISPKSLRILLTASDEPETFEAAIKKGIITKILTKPFKPHELISEIKQLCSNRNSA